MPDMPAKLDLAVGGQALIEGVMIRAPKAIGIAVRTPSGQIVLKHEVFESFTARFRILKLPIVRGVVNLIETMVIGVRALNFSAEKAFDEGEEKDLPKAPKSRLHKVGDGVLFGLNILFSLALAIALFKFVPLFIATWLQKFSPALANSTILFNLTDGAIRIAIFFLYIFILSLIPAFHRVFEYHGAEHKAVFAYEQGLTLNYENTQKQSPRHPRCGTSFIMIVLIVSILILSLVPRNPDFVLNLLARISVLPLIAGLSYEVLKWTARYQKHPLLKILTYPGIVTQYITTKEPDKKQIEVAIAALETAVKV